LLIFKFNPLFQSLYFTRKYLVAGLLLWGATIFSHISRAQGFTYELTGDPVDITGWAMADDSYVDDDEIVLTDPMGNQVGYIYYETPSSLTDCSQFTVTFDFTITNSSFPTADGLAFWYLSNPPTGFIDGGGIGMPTGPEGLILVFDTYNNDGFPDNNPLISMRSMDGSVNYTEGDGVGLIDGELENQSWIIDEEWHTCIIDYYYGTITVSFDGGAPVLEGTLSLDGFDGYFGFSAGTGASYAKHRIRNVLITGAPEPEPPLVENISYCLDAEAVPLTADGENLTWYSSATATTPLPEAPIPNTSTVGTYTWYVTQQIDGCDLESSRAAITVTVVAPPPPPSITYISNYCKGAPFVPFSSSASEVLWYDAATGGIGSSTFPVVNTDVVGTYTFYASQVVDGCESELRTPVTVQVHELPGSAFDYEIKYGCTADTIVLTNHTNNATSYYWTFGDGTAPSTDEHAQHIYTTQGEYGVRLTATLGTCSDSILKFINTMHPLNASFLYTQDTICEGGMVSFTNTSIASSIGGVDPTYYWDFRDGSTATTQSPTHVFTKPGVYDVMLVITDFVPCSDTVYHTIFVDSLGRATFQMSDSILCVGDGIMLHATFVENGVENFTWTFSDNGNVVQNINPTLRSYDVPGVYDITLDVTYRQCPEASFTRSVWIKPMPIVNLGPDTALCLNGAPIYLNSIADISSDARWQWNTGDTTAMLKIVHPGTYYVTADLDGCKGSDEIIVRKDCYIDVPNSFSPNNDGVNDYFFPRQWLSDGITAFKMAVFNRWGQKVFETFSPDGRGWDGKFNGVDQPAGVYIYVIEIVMKNMIKEHYDGNVTLIR
jgi:gliding motility-associated-like protein